MRSGGASLYDRVIWTLKADKAAFLEHTSCDIVPVRAFRMEPATTQTGYLSIDAESYPFAPLQGQILAEKGRIMAHQDDK